MNIHAQVSGLELVDGNSSKGCGNGLAEGDERMPDDGSTADAEQGLGQVERQGAETRSYSRVQHRVWVSAHMRVNVGCETRRETTEQRRRTFGGTADQDDCLGRGSGHD